MFGRSFASLYIKVSMKKALLLTTLLLSLGSNAATNCSLESFVKSPEGQEKLSSLADRSKGLIISKLEELGIEEQQIEVKAVYPKTAEDLRSSLSVLIKAKNLNAEGSSFTLTKVTRDEDCGVEISILNGQILNKESGKNFGSLGRIKEFVRMN